MKKRIILGVLLGVLVVSFITYKILVINYYKAEKIDINTSKIFDKEIVVTTSTDLDDNKIIVGDMSFHNYFEDFERSTDGSSILVKRDESGETLAGVIYGFDDSYITALKNKEDIFGLSDTEQSSSKNLSGVTKTAENFLKANNINTIVDYFNYMKNNYYISSNIFTSVNKMKLNYNLNSIISSLPAFDSITLISGDINGYILNHTYIEDNVDESEVDTTSKVYKVINIEKDEKIYSITLLSKVGGEITSDAFVEELLKTITFE